MSFPGVTGLNNHRHRGRRLRMRVSFAGQFGQKPTISVGLDSGAQTHRG
jgi:hypothetical protein